MKEKIKTIPTRVALDEGILREIQAWLNEMEKKQPGFTGWFRIEFENRFPEFESCFHKKAEQGRKMEREKYPDQEKRHKIIQFNKASHLRIVK